MPAVTVDDITTLPKIGEADPAASADRAVVSVTSAPSGFEGEGFPVRRAFAGVDLADLDPFVHLDQMGEVEYAPGEPKGTPWHPHRGFETVTYMIDGTFQHRDSTGGGGLITNGDTQWMTAGAGILHIERPPDELVASGAVLRLIAGELGGHRGPGITHTPITLVHATVAPGAQLALPWPSEHNALAYVLAGRGRAGSAGRPLASGQLAVFGPGGHVVLAADPTQEGRAPRPAGL